MKLTDAEDLPALHLAGLLHLAQSVRAQVGNLQPPQDQLMGWRHSGTLILFAHACKVDFLLARGEVLLICEQNNKESAISKDQGGADVTQQHSVRSG